MNTKFFRLLIFTLLFLLSLSCEKEKDFPKIYVFSSFNPGDIKGYTNSGDISDKEKINKFIKDNIEYFWDNDFQSNDWRVEIQIISDSKALISDSDTTIYYNLIRKDEILYFQFTDTVISYGSLTNERLKYSPLYINTIPVPIGIGQQMTAYIPCFYMIESNGYLLVPFVSYIENIYGNTGELISTQGIGNYNNEFNHSYLSKVQNIGNLIDTIVYQDNSIIF
ncbi:MAG: hypothetical protein HC896_14165 [Bacteroidales bacterium]|nr:hypothetical protein [Bacteroidales bacterium]